MKSEIPEEEREKMISNISKKLEMVSKISERLKIKKEGKGWRDLGTYLGTCLVILDGFPEEMKEIEIMNHLKDNLMLSQYNEIVF